MSRPADLPTPPFRDTRILPLHPLMIVLLLTAGVRTLSGACFEVELSTLPSRDLLPDTVRCRESNGSVLCGCLDDEKAARTLARKLHGTIRPGKKKTPSAAPTDEELKLMVQTFIYQSDLRHAYQVAQLALKRHPDSLYWHRKAAQICQWSGRNAEAIRHRLFLYRHDPSPALRNTIIRQSLDTRQYSAAAPLVKDRMFEHPSPETIRTFLRTWERAGRPIRAARTLETLYRKHPQYPEALVQALRLYLGTGRLDDARRVVRALHDAHIDTPLSLELRARYYYIRHDLPRSYRLLREAAKRRKHPSDTLLRSLSDLGWYLGQRRSAGEASRILLERNKGLHRDYERILTAFPRSSVALATARKAWKRFGTVNDFYTYAYLALEQKKGKELLREIERIRKKPALWRSLEKDPLFYLIRAQAERQTGRYRAAVRSLEEARRRDPDNPEILAALLWTLRESRQDRELERLLRELSRRDSLPQSLWLPMASGYFTLQRVDRSADYLRKLLRREPDNLDLHLLAAYIDQARNEHAAALKEMRFVYQRLEKRKKAHPALMRQPAFLERYLQSALFCVGADRYRAILRASRPYLSPERYRIYALSWALHLDANAWAERLRQQMRRPEPWQRMSLALRRDDTYRMRRLLYRYYRDLPLRDRVLAAQKSGELEWAHYLAFRGLEHNRQDELLYDQMRQSAMKIADRIEAESAFRRRGEDLDRPFLHLKGRHSFGGPYRWGVEATLASNRLRSSETYRSLPATDAAFSLSFQRLFDRGEIHAGLGIRNEMESFATADIGLSWQFHNRWELRLDGYWHDEADETTSLLLGGYRNGLSGRLSYRLLPSTTLSALLEGWEYRGQDDTRLGEGIHWLLRADRQFRIGYPDLSAALTLEGGDYSERSGPHGTIDSLLRDPRTRLLPDDDTVLGLTFGYGMQNAVAYTRVWRPFAEFSAYYSLRKKDPSLGFSGGIGGELFNQDHLVLGVDYGQELLGTRETTFTFYLRYTLLY